MSKNNQIDKIKVKNYILSEIYGCTSYCNRELIQRPCSVLVSLQGYFNKSCIFINVRSILYTFTLHLFAFKISIPGLPITLGVYLKMFNMLEKYCHSLDLDIAVNVAQKDDVNDTNFGDYVEQVKTLRYISA